MELPQIYDMVHENEIHVVFCSSSISIDYQLQTQIEDYAIGLFYHLVV